MRTVRSVVWGAVGVLLLSPVGAQAAKPKGPLAAQVRPSKPLATQPFTVTFRAGKLKPGERYQVGWGMYGSVNCTPGYFVRLRRQKPGSLVRVRFTPDESQATGQPQLPGGPVNPPRDGKRFCAGPAAIEVMAVDVDGRFRYFDTGARVTITEDAAYPQVPDTATRVTVIDGSVAVKAAGRPDRNMQLGGSLRGVVPGVIKLNTDIAVGSFTGGLAFKTLTPDPLCAGDRYAPDLSVVPGGTSTLVLKQSGEATFTLQLVTDPMSLAGCAAPATSQPTTLTLTGRVTSDGLTKLPLSGTLSGVPIAAGVTADLTVSLLLNVDLSGRG